MCECSFEIPSAGSSGVNTRSFCFEYLVGHRRFVGVACLGRSRSLTAFLPMSIDTENSQEGNREKIPERGERRDREQRGRVERGNGEESRVGLESKIGQTIDYSQDWILLQLADSALPVGGFVASGGLEAASQMAQVSQQSFSEFVTNSLSQLAHSSLPYIHEAFKILNSDAEDRNEHLGKLDLEYDAMCSTNHVNNRASTQQGVAYLSLLTRSFPDIKDLNLATKFKHGIRSKKLMGHLPICFTVCCYCLGLTLGILFVPYLTLE